MRDYWYQAIVLLCVMAAILVFTRVIAPWIMGG
jgi:hypothetical protein